jgi:hypothetical protein
MLKNRTIAADTHTALWKGWGSIMKNSTIALRHAAKSRCIAAIFMLSVAIMIPCPYAAPARAIVKDLTVKAADGRLLRGMSPHISKTYSSRNLAWGLNKRNLIDVRDKLQRCVVSVQAGGFREVRSMGVVN